MAEWGAADSTTWVDGADDTTVVVDTASETDIDTTFADDGIKEDKGKKVWRIRKNEIEELQTERSDGVEKFVTIFKRSGKGRALEVYREKFPRKALAVFSEVWKKEIEREGNAGLLIINEPSGNMLPYGLILDWMNLCIDEGNDIKFPEIEEHQNQLHVVLDVIAVADYIKIPGKSLQEPLKKAAIRYARKNLIDIDYIVHLYDVADTNYDDAERLLQEAAAASIFEAWWTRQLDEPEFDEYCSHIEQLRVEFEQLDKDLNARFDEKKGFIEKKRDERRTKMAPAPIVPDAGTVKDAVDDGWGNAATSAAAGQEEWAATDTSGAEEQPSSGWDNGGW